MAVLFEDAQLLSLMEDFYILTGIRIVLFDEKFTEIVSYPSDDENFCGIMRKNKNFDDMCRACDKKACLTCLNTHKTYIYTCHAGLTEAISPIIGNGIIIGYIMFGQVSDTKNKEQLASHTKYLCDTYMPGVNITKKIKYKSQRQILAASKILEALAEYIHLKGMIRLSENQIISKTNSYIDNNISNDITVHDLCGELGISRTRLYEIVKNQTGEGVSTFIRNKKLDYSKHLIKTTDMKITEISSKAGFSDYNYFLRLFKKRFGVSPKSYRGKMS